MDLRKPARGPADRRPRGKLAMALKGTLRDFGLADIFQLIGIQRKTGLLVLTNLLNALLLNPTLLP